MRKRDIIVKPGGAGPFPAVILLHGCGGLSSREKLWAGRLRDWGYLSLRVNSFAARGLKRVCGGGTLRPEERIPDVLAALAYLRTRPDVDRRRVALMGWSHGGSATLAAFGNALAERQRRAGLDVTQVKYPGAYHGFDNLLLGPNRRRIPDALGGRGATIQYDPAAAEDSLVPVREFLTKHLTN